MTLCQLAIQAVASKRGLAATFFPVPHAHDMGSGLHTHFSLCQVCSWGLLLPVHLLTL